LSYKVHVTKSIWTNDERTELLDSLYYDLELPFVPFIGLQLQRDGWHCGPIERVAWDGDEECFRVEAQGRTPDDEDMGDAEDFRRIDMGYGWKSHVK
jgi:hypothetical protein